MKTIKKKLFRLFFMSEIIIVSCFYFFGPQGIPVYLQLRRENTQLQQSIFMLEKDIKALEDEKSIWCSHADYFCEKYAREKLHMAYKDELIYVSS